MDFLSLFLNLLLIRRIIDVPVSGVLLWVVGIFSLTVSSPWELSRLYALSNSWALAALTSPLNSLIASLVLRSLSGSWSSFDALEMIQNKPNSMVFTFAFPSLNSTVVCPRGFWLSWANTSLQLAFTPDWVGVHRRNCSYPTLGTFSVGKLSTAYFERGFPWGLISTKWLIICSVSPSGTTCLLTLHSWIQTSLVFDDRDPSGRSTDTPLQYTPPPEGPNIALATAVNELGSGTSTLYVVLNFRATLSANRPMLARFSPLNPWKLTSSAEVPAKCRGKWRKRLSNFVISQAY